MEQMRKDGVCADILTDQYMRDVIRSAPRRRVDIQLYDERKLKDGRNI